MPVSSFLQWLQDTSFSAALRDSTWAEPVVETIHVLTLTVFLGFTVLLDLRLLGVAMRHERISEVLDELNPPIIGAFLIMLATGALLFCGDPVAFYGTIFFRVKMIMLILADQRDDGQIGGHRLFGLMGRDCRCWACHRLRCATTLRRISPRCF
jgi:hypothetical protein